MVSLERNGQIPPPSGGRGVAGVQIIRDLTAGAVSALASIPQTLPLGLIVFAPLSSDGLLFAATAALISAALFTAVASLTGGIPLQLAGPRAGSCFLIAGYTTSLAGDPFLAANPGTRLGSILLLIAVLALLAGLLQIVIGALKLARIVKFVPHSVVVGFNAAVGISIILTFLPQLFGLSPGARLTEPSVVQFWSPTATIASAVTILVALVWPRFDRRIPALLVALLAGLLTYALLDPALWTAKNDLKMNPWMHGKIDAASVQLAVAYLQDPPQVARLLLVAAALALVLSLESLLALATYDAFTGSYSDADRELKAHGLGNVAVAFGLGLASSSSWMRTRVSYDIGGRTRLATLFHAALMAGAAVAGSALDMLPTHVLAALLIVTALSLFDRSILAIVRGAWSSGEARRDFAALLLMVASGLLLSPLAPVILGLVCSSLYMIVDMSRGIIKNDITGQDIRSHRMRTIPDARTILERAERIRIVSLEGVLFFGTGDAIRRHAEVTAKGSPGFLIYDCRGLTTIDASGRTALTSSVQRLTKAGWSVAIAAPRPALLLAVRRLVADAARLFDDLDAALEWAEDGILGHADDDIAPMSSFEAAASELLRGQPRTVIQTIAGCARPRELSAGELLFRPGERGDAIYILAAGRIRIQARIDGGPRLATFLPGVVFGEMAFLDGHPRSAAAIAERPGLAYELKRDELDRALMAHPEAKTALMENIALLLASRLRETNRRMTTE